MLLLLPLPRRQVLGRPCARRTHRGRTGSKGQGGGQLLRPRHGPGGQQVLRPLRRTLPRHG
eukprot:1699889-Lingulodinium_polyedra.AAC.1